MELDQEIARALSLSASQDVPRLRDIPLDVARSEYDSSASLLDPDPPVVESIADIEVPGAAGMLGARLITPTDADASSGLVIWFHGGGWAQGGLTSHEPALRRLAAASGQRFLAVDYRLAPEHPFPAGLDDAEAVLSWCLSDASGLGSSPGSVAVGGDSAGATLALVAAFECARDGFRPAFQVLCYPSLGPDLKTDSLHDFAEGYGLTGDDMSYLYGLYLPKGQSHADPRVSPLLTPDLHEAPPAIIAVAGFDPLRDEGLALAGLLEGSGVEVDLFDESSLNHGFIRMGGVAAARSAIERLGSAVSARFAASRPG